MTVLSSKERIDIAIINPELEVVEWAKRALSYQFPLQVLLPHYELAPNSSIRQYSVRHWSHMALSHAHLQWTKETLREENELKLGYPFWIRSALGSSGLGAMKINSFDELQNWINVNPKVEKFLASEFLPGRNLGCKMLYHNGELFRSAIAERVYYIMAKVAPSGNHREYLLWATRKLS